MSDDMNYWFYHRERLVGALFLQQIYGVGIERVQMGNFWWFLVRLLNKEICCGCAGCERAYAEDCIWRPVKISPVSQRCRLTEALNLFLHNNGIPPLHPESGCILDPKGDGMFMVFDKETFSEYNNIEVKKKFTIMMHCVERSWINFMDEYIDPSRLEIDVGVLRCPICLSEDGHLKKLVCGHSFHGTCMKLWFSKCLNCPLCRLSFKRETEKLLSKWIIDKTNEKKNIANN
jgi:hypothetical protein